MSGLDFQNQHTECKWSYTRAQQCKILGHQGQPHLKLKDNGVILTKSERQIISNQEFYTQRIKNRKVGQRYFQRFKISKIFFPVHTLAYEATEGCTYQDEEVI